MEELLFSQASLALLVRIRRKLEREFGFDFRLSDRRQILELLTAAAASPDRGIRHDYHAFLAALDRRQRDHLQRLGIRIPDILEAETAG